MGDLVLDDETAGIAMVVAMAVRNEMEDFHHEHLSDEQMAELNPIIRNAIATALFSLAHPDDPRCRTHEQQTHERKRQAKAAVYRLNDGGRLCVARLACGPSAGLVPAFGSPAARPDSCHV
jgi:hypothetical protein